MRKKSAKPFESGLGCAVHTGSDSRMIRSVSQAALVLIAILVVSCSGNTPLVTEDGSVSSEARDALIAPAILNSKSNRLKEQDLAKAYNALVEVLGQSAPYSSVPWGSNQSRNFGEITPGPRFFINDSFCLYFTHRYTLNRLQFMRNGTACTDSNGNWQSLE